MSTLKPPGELTLEDLFALPLAEQGEGTEEAEDPPNPVLPTVPEIIWGALFFFALWVVMRYVLLPPIQRTREERAAKIAQARESADQASTDRSAVQAEYDAAMAEARQEAARIVDAARAEAEEYRLQVVAEATAEVETRHSAAMAELEQARSAAVGSLRDDVTAVAVGAASSVLGRSIDPASHGATVQRYLDGS